MTDPISAGRFDGYPCACLSAIVLFFLFMAACGQSTQTGEPQIEQTAAQPEMRGVNQTKGQSLPYVPDEVLVKFRSAADAETITRILKKLKLETIRTYSSPNLFLVKITDKESVETIIKRLNTFEAVEYAEPNYGVKATQ